MPSEAQREYVCRAGTTTLYSFGDNDGQLGDYAWYSSNSESRTHTVGTMLPNNWGLYDMMGNVWEWVLDSYHTTGYVGAPTDGSAWDPDTGTTRIVRGGNWLSNNYWWVYCKSAFRTSYTPGTRTKALGFRVFAMP